jgi:DNA mismatch repair protein MutS2
MSKLENSMAYKSKKKSSKHHDASDFHVGDEFIYSLSLAGTCRLCKCQRRLIVQMGMMRSLVNIKDLEITKTVKQVKREDAEMPPQHWTDSYQQVFFQQSEINVMGMTVDEAIAQLDKYIDDAALQPESDHVVHGKGTVLCEKTCILTSSS